MTNPARDLIAIITTAALASSASADSLLSCGWNSNDVDRCGAFIAPGTGGMTRPHSMDIGPDGLLYVTSSGTNSILRFDPFTGAFIDAFIEPPNHGGLTTPMDVTWDAGGNMYVTSMGTDSVLRYNGATGAFIDAFVAPPNHGGLDQPEGIDFGPDGNLYVSSLNLNKVIRYNGTTGVYIDDFVVGVGELSGPHHFVFQPGGDLIVSSFNNHRVLRYDASNGAFLEIIAEGVANNLRNAHGLALDDEAQLYVTSFGGNAVLRYDIGTNAFIDAPVAGGSSGTTAVVYLRQDALPESFIVPFGEHTGGDAASMAASDDDYVRIEQRPAVSVLLPLIRAEIEGTANEECFDRLVVTVEAAVNSLPGQPPQKLWLRNFTAGWTLVDERTASLADTVVEAEIGMADSWRYIEPGTDRMLMRIEWFDPGNVFSPAWGARIDQAVWTLKP
jgi:streptogramin lyase